MITPQFEFEQDAKYLYVKISIPYVNLNTISFDLKGSHLTFIAKPYFLRLSLPRECISDGREKVSYNPFSNIATLTLPKEKEGEFFPNLSMLTEIAGHKTKLGQESKQEGSFIQDVNPSSSIERSDISFSSDDYKCEKELKSREVEAMKHLSDDEKELDAEIDDVTQFLKDHSPEKQKELLHEKLDKFLTSSSSEGSSIPIRFPPSSSEGMSYGFNRGHNGVIAATGCMSWGLLLSNPETVSPIVRRIRRLEEESKAFDDEQYMSGYVLDHEEKKKESVICPWEGLVPSESRDSIFDGIHRLTQRDKDDLMLLKPKEYILDDKNEIKRACLTLVAVLYSICYHARTEGFGSLDSEAGIKSDMKVSGEEDGMATSALTGKVFCLNHKHYPCACYVISTLCPLFQHVDDSFTSLRDLVGTLIRRSLTWSLFRSYSFAIKVLRDCSELFRVGGRVLILSALLRLRKLFNSSDTHYIYNKLWIDDLCVWIQAERMDMVCHWIGEEMAKVIPFFDPSSSVDLKDSKVEEEDDRSLVKSNVTRKEKDEEESLGEDGGDCVDGKEYVGIIFGKQALCLKALEVLADDYRHVFVDDESGERKEFES
ncbi:Protein Shq1 like protein [Aduncisulcus paluster]|uniref:Protein Shq1 like protein n=1 Tax=Aduncisulcus paluster TaxID=2918883 RepID=A0ABQ5K1Q1_9EUKA|nr:Protein Shq1 like protein [Aduncisulcus paluster]